MHPPLTEGARRTLGMAARLAQADRTDRFTPPHLLWALVLAESRAAEILCSHGISRDELCQALPIDDALTQAGATDCFDDVAVRPDELVAKVIEKARQRALLGGRYCELGSEHLLWGLAVVDSPVADNLRNRGIDDKTLSAAISESTGVCHDPIEVDISIRRHQQTPTDHHDTLRILDAAANRAREGLRVLEDFVRFTLGDVHLSGLLKSCRHDLSQALAETGSVRLVTSRDTLGDVGTDLTTPTEVQRETPGDVVIANFKRAQEAMRTLEEFSKVAAPCPSDFYKKLRYHLYTIEKSVLLCVRNRGRLDGRNLYLLVTEALCDRGLGPAVRGALNGGAGIVQLREKSMSDRQMIERGQFIRQWTRETGALFIVNDRPDLAVLMEADGVHVGQDELTVFEARRIIGPDRLVGVSTHTIEQARQAVLDGADYLGVGPVFGSKTKDFDELAGLNFVRQVAAQISLPWFAIGGIDAGQIAKILQAGATRVAVSSAVCGAVDPQRAAGELSVLLNAGAVEGDSSSPPDPGEDGPVGGKPEPGLSPELGSGS